MSIEIRRPNRVYLISPELNTIDGIAEHLLTLGRELVSRGIDVRFFVRRPYLPNNQYAKRFKDCGIPVVSPPRALAFLGQIDWAARDRLLQRVVNLFSPLLLLPAVADALVRRRAFHRSWQSMRSVFNGLLSRFLLPDFLDHVFYTQLDWAYLFHRPDVVEVSRWDYSEGVLWGRRHGLPTIHKMNGMNGMLSEKQLDELKKATCLISVSAADGKKLLAAGANTHVFVVQNSVDVPAGDAGSEDQPRTKQEGTTVTITCTSRLSQEKGTQYMPAVAQKVLAKTAQARFVIAGDGPLRQSIERSCADKGLTTYVRFLGAISREQVLELLRATDIFVLPSLSEGMPHGMLEAMACGTAIVATDLEGTSELIIDAVTGLLVPPADPDALAEVILQLVNDRALRNKLAGAAWQAYRTGRWIPQATADLTLAAYQFAMQTHEADRTKSV